MELNVSSEERDHGRFAIQIHCEKALKPIVREAAKHNGSTVTAYVRGALLEKLRSDSFLPTRQATVPPE